MRKLGTEEGKQAPKVLEQIKSTIGKDSRSLAPSKELFPSYHTAADMGALDQNRAFDTK